MYGIVQKLLILERPWQLDLIDGINRTKRETGKTASYKIGPPREEKIAK